MSRSLFRELALGTTHTRAAHRRALAGGGPLGGVFAEPGVAPHYGPSWAADLTHIDLQLDLFVADKRWDGQATLYLRPYPAFAGTVRLSLTEVDVCAVQDASGKDLHHSLADDTLTVRGVDLPAEGGSITVRWKGHDPRAGLYFVGPTPSRPDRPVEAWTQCQDEDARHVFPCFDHPGTKHTWSIRLTGPEGHTLLSNGERTGSGVEGGRAWATWEQREPMPAYLFTAVSAQLDTVHVPAEELKAAGITTPVAYHVPKGRSAEAVPAMGRTPEMIRFLNDWTGVPYAWPRYDQVVVHDFVFGGMENTACTTMMERLLCDEASRLHTGMDSLVVHELAHQWFGDLVTCQDWSQGWLNEAFATFSEQIWWEHAYPADEAQWVAHDHHADYLAEDGGRYRRPIASYLFRAPIDLFDRHLYEKGAMILRTLRAELGDAGFRAGVTRYLQDHAHGTVHGRDLQRAMEQATGRNLDRFIHQWILSAGHPELTVEIEPGERQLTVRVTQGQSGPEVPEAFAFTLPMQIVFADGSQQALSLSVAERERAWTVPLAEGQVVDVVRIDPEMAVLCTITLAAPTPMLAGLSRDPSPVLAKRALQVLAKRDTPAARKALRQALTSHPFWGVRATAAGLWAKRGTEEGLQLLTKALESESEIRALEAVAKALGTFRRRTAADALEGALEGEPVSSQVQGALLEALGRTRDPRAVSVLADHLDVESWGEVVRARVLSGLAATRSPDAFPLLLAWSQPEKPEFARAAAAGALAALGEAVPALTRQARERLVEMLKEPGYRAHIATVRALAVLKDPAGIAALQEVRTTTADGRLQRLAYEAMASLQQGSKADQGVALIGQQVEAQAKTIAALRSRLDALESKHDVA